MPTDINNFLRSGGTKIITDRNESVKSFLSSAYQGQTKNGGGRTGEGPAVTTPPINSGGGRSKPITTPTQTEQTIQAPKVAGYSPRLRGVVTSTGQYFPTTNINFMPIGYGSGFVKEKEVQNNKIEVSVIPKQAIKLPKLQKIQEIKTITTKPQTQEQTNNSFKSSSKHIAKIFTLGEVGETIYDIGKQVISSTGRVAVKIGSSVNFPFTKTKVITQTEKYNIPSPTFEDYFTTASIPLGAYSKTALTGLGVIGTYYTAKAIKQNPLILEEKPAKIGTYTILSASALKEGAYYSVLDRLQTLKMIELKMPSVNVKPFERRNQIVYMERAKKFSFVKPSTWENKVLGYKAGQFTERRYRIIAPEVLNKFYGGKGTNFPFDKPATFKNWFEEKNIKTYGLPKSSQLKNKPFGYSATSGGGKIKQIGDAGLFVSGKGVSIAFLRLGKGKDLLGQDFMIGNKPYIYSIYGKNTKVVSKAYEIKVKNPYDMSGKPIKKYIFPNTKRQEGTFYIPTNKPEVQAVVYGKIKPIRKSFYIKLAGRRVRIGEFITSEDKLAKQKYKNVKEELAGYSSLPKKPSYYPKSVYYKISTYSIPKSSFVGSSFKSSPSSKISSSFSSISSKSYISKPSSSYSFSRSISSLVSKSKASSSSSKSSNRFKQKRSSVVKNIYRKVFGRKGIFGYKTYYTRKGKKIYLSGVRSRGEAIRFGEVFTTKNLRATFGVTKTAYKLYGAESKYKPSNIFRGFRIRKGKAIPLIDTFIQRRGKRLTFRGEINELQRARRITA